MAMGIPLMIALSILGYQAFDQLFEALPWSPEARKLKLGKAQIAAQEKMTLASLEGQRRASTESRAAARKHLEALMKMEQMEREERRGERSEARLMSSQDRQMAMLFQAMQSLGQRDMGAGQGAGMLAALRGF